MVHTFQTDDNIILCTRSKYPHGYSRTWTKLNDFTDFWKLKISSLFFHYKFFQEIFLILIIVKNELLGDPKKTSRLTLDWEKNYLQLDITSIQIGSGFEYNCIMRVVFERVVNKFEN